MNPRGLIPAFLNPDAGSAEDARKVLTDAGGFELREVAPDDLAAEIRKEVEGGATRILVSGGDGTIGIAAGIIAGTEVELAILPGGTLNHFARDTGIPEDLVEAADVAANGRPIKADVAYVGDRIFLNTSSIGAYVSYVRVRERFESRLGYHLASFLALIRIFARLRTVRIELEMGGRSRWYTTPMIFIGVGERELRMPNLGSRVERGRTGLQVMVLSGRSRARLFVLALAAVARGTRSAAQTPELDSFIVDRCRIDLGREHASIAVDGEIVVMDTPLEYRIERESLNVVVPSGPRPVQGDRRAR